jgi:hypothetical protein
MSASPVLGVASTTNGTLGLYSSATANAVTLQNVGATSAYNWNFPVTAGSSSQILTSGGGGATANGWTNLCSLLTAGTNVTITGTTNCTVAASVSGTAPTVTEYTTAASSYTLGTTNLETVAFNQATTYVSTIDLPATPAANLRKCVKDGGNGFATHNATVKTTDSATIDGVAGSTGVLLNQNREEQCYLYDSSDTNWEIE